MVADRPAPPAVGVGSWIERRARIAPQGVAIVHGASQVTYAELAGRIRRLANGLLDLGVEPGDRLAWLGPNHPAFLEALFSAGLLGCVLAPVNHRLPVDGMSLVLRDIEPRIVLRHRVPGPVPLPASVRHRLDIGEPSTGALDYEEVVAGSSDDRIDVPVDFDDVLMLPHTSGTVGTPKGVMLTHANITWNVINLLSVADVRQGDVTIASAPFFRVGGTGVNVLPVLFMGGTVVVPGDADPDRFLDDAERYGVTVGFGNPDLLADLAAAPRWPVADLSSIRFFITGGAPVPERLIRRYLERGITLLQGYGLSEAAPVVLLLDPAGALAKVGSAGRPALMVEVRIEADGGRDAAPGQTGELWVRGPNVMAGYWRNAEATRQVLTSDGWLRTGDAARIDEDGYVWIVDRMRDGFRSEGGLVFPGDVERVLLEHPDVDDVAVVGVLESADSNTAVGLETGVAFVVRADGRDATAEAIAAFARERLEAHQVPMAVVFVEDLPRNTVGKLQRARLRDQWSTSPAAR